MRVRRYDVCTVGVARIGLAAGLKKGTASVGCSGDSLALRMEERASLALPKFLSPFPRHSVSLEASSTASSHP
jgi:hypothetical protein